MKGHLKIERELVAEWALEQEKQLVEVTKVKNLELVEV
jgi:hypothetical protein